MVKSPSAWAGWLGTHVVVDHKTEDMVGLVQHGVPKEGSDEGKHKLFDVDALTADGHLCSWKFKCWLVNFPPCMAGILLIGPVYLKYWFQRAGGKIQSGPVFSPLPGVVPHNLKYTVRQI